MNLYKLLWSKIGGRPWTYILRDIWDETEWLMQLLWFGLGALTFWLTRSWLLIGILWGIYTLGYVNGHLFWGNKKITGQKGS